MHETTERASIMLKMRVLWLAVLGITLGVLVATCAVPARASAVTATPVLQSGAVSYSARVSTPSVDGLRLRSRPGYSGRAKGLLYRGDCMVRSGHRSGPWVEVVVWYRDSRTGLRRGTWGWVHSGYLNWMTIYRR
ncbi:SH3 domain-containing protein [Streptomyces sp. NPDC051018]|uniref:SH3 domain-containing protein n=1 Tax=Streptomyces sp. NPDC051018 TaxID=3365639 RepID=UPI00378AB26C